MCSKKCRVAWVAHHLPQLLCVYSIDPEGIANIVFVKLFMLAPLSLLVLCIIIVNIDILGHALVGPSNSAYVAGL